MAFGGLFFYITLLGRELEKKLVFCWTNFFFFFFFFFNIFTLLLQVMTIIYKFLIFAFRCFSHREF